MRSIRNYIRRLLKEQSKRRKAAVVLTVLSLMVVCGVFWALKLTGISLADDVCTLEEHTHSETCYTTVTVCGMEEDESHTHTANCYVSELICGKEVHVHTEECMGGNTEDQTTQSTEETATDVSVSTETSEPTEEVETDTSAATETSEQTEESTEPTEDTEAPSEPAEVPKRAAVRSVSTVLAQGTCGPTGSEDSVSWTLTDDGVLTISGTGAMRDYDKNNRPSWSDYEKLISDVVIEQGVTTVGDYAFYLNTTVESVSLPEGLQTIGKYAFALNSSISSAGKLTEITIPDSVTEVYNYAFQYCRNLTTVNISENSNLYYLYGGSFGYTGITEFYVPASLGRFGPAFVGCKQLERFSSASTGRFQAIDGVLFAISEQGEGVPEVVAVYPPAKKDISCTFPDTITRCYQSAFYDCDNLRYVYFNDGLTKLDGYVFYDCDSLLRADLPEGLESIGSYCFTHCSLLYHADIPDTVTTMEAHVFQNCSNLTEVRYSESMTSIPSYTFYYCSALRNIEIPASVTLIDSDAFCRCSLLSDVSFLGDSQLTTIGAGAFFYCTSLAEITLPETVTAVKATAFESCTKLASINLPDGLTEIGYSAFKNCDALTEITIPGAVTLGEKNPTTSGSVTTYYGVFTDCDNLTTVTIEEGAAKTSKFTFYNCPKLTTVNLPESLWSVSYGTFCGCTSLQNVRFPTAPEKGYFVITAGAFQNCSALETLMLPEGTTAVAKAAFLTCTNLRSIYIPGAVNVIQERAFADCTSLEEVYFNAKDLMFIDSNGVSTGGIQVNAFRNSCFDLTIGKDVNFLFSDFLELSDHAGRVMFDGGTSGNVLQIEEGALSTQPLPLKNLQGLVYVDPNGFVYTFDTESKTATLVYCSPNITSGTVPATITIPGADLAEVYAGPHATDVEPLEDIVCTVTSVASDALQLANELQELRFASPETVTLIASRAFANCPTLMSVNGQTTVTGASQSFSNAAVPSNAFFNTGLLEGNTAGIYSGELDGTPSLTVGDTQNSVTVSVDTKKEKSPTLIQDFTDEGIGGYRLLTNDTLYVHARTSSDTSEALRFRLYCELTDYHGVVSILPMEGVEPEPLVHIEGTNLYYLPFTVEGGVVADYAISVYYPATTAGGGARFWAVREMEGEEIDASAPAKTVQAYWSRIINTFTLTKTAPASVSLAATQNSDTSIAITAAETIVFPFTLEVEGARQWNGTDAPDDKGTDYVKYVDFTDTLTLPEGMDWSELMKTGTIVVTNSGATGTDSMASCYIKANGTNVARIDYLNTNLSISKVGLIRDEGGTITVSWRLSRKTTKELSLGQTPSIVFYPEAFTVDPACSMVREKQTLEMSNIMTAAPQYQFSGSGSVLTSRAAAPVSAPDGFLSLNLKIIKTPSYMGEPLYYEATVRNTGVTAYYGQNESEGDTTCFVYDPLNSALYISPENMERMFAEDEYKGLFISIYNGESSERVPVQFAQDGVTDAVKHVGNSDSERLSERIRIGWNDDRTALAYRTDSMEIQADIPDGMSIRELLEALGYFPTKDTQYLIYYYLRPDDDGVRLESGESRSFRIYANVKDTFMYLSADYPTRYNNTKGITSIPNNANFWWRSDESGAVKFGETATAPLNTASAFEATISLSAARNGKTMVTDEDKRLSPGDTLNYMINFSHYGVCTYEDLPMVFQISGSQVFLAPKIENPGLIGLGLGEYTYGGVEYYCLDKAGTYHNVLIGTDPGGVLRNAAEITVQVDTAENDSSKITNISSVAKWYFTDTPAGRYTDITEVLTYVEPELEIGGKYNVSAKVYMNDRTARRIYAIVSYSGAGVSGNKEILDVSGKPVPEGYTWITEGEEIQYRLSIFSGGTFTVNGSKFLDILPNTKGVFAWEKGVNVQIRAERVYRTGENAGTVEAIDELGEKWDIVRTAGTSHSKEAEGVYYIQWSDEINLTFNRDEYLYYIYVTLTLPRNDTESGKLTWKEYITEVQGAQVTNTFELYGTPYEVYHYLSQPGEAWLQKGAVKTVRYAERDKNFSVQYFNDGRYYSPSGTAETTKRAILYYIALVNTGDTRLYIGDFYDEIPDGLTYWGLYDGSYSYKYGVIYYPGVRSTLTNSNFVADSDLLLENTGKKIKWVSMQINNGVLDTATDMYRFSIYSNTTNFDSDLNRWYLNPGEGLQFAYWCKVDPETETDLTETVTKKNTVYMPVDTLSGSEVNLTPASGGRQGIGLVGIVSDNPDYANDGSCTVFQKINNNVPDRISNLLGRNDTGCLSSSVTVTRGTPFPDTTIDAYAQTLTGNTTYYSEQVDYSTRADAAVIWQTKLDNSSFYPIRNYTVTHTMDKPYTFIGDVTFAIYQKNAADDDQIIADSECKLVTFGYYSGSTDRWYSTDKGVTKLPLTLGEECSLGDNTGRTMIVSRDENGNEVLTLRFGQDGDEIPENCYAQLMLTTENVTGTRPGSVFTNAVDFYTTQTDTTKSDSVTISISPDGYVVSAYKTVEQGSGDELQSASTQPGKKNYITLPSIYEPFRYTLTVINRTDYGIKDLVIIDNLPQPGDSNPRKTSEPRNSAFKVSLTDEPFELVVQHTDGTEIVLGTEDYTVEFSTETTFDSADWTGTADSKWQASQTEARAIRIQLHDESGELVQAGMTLQIRYGAVADTQGTPCGKAWNSFGYQVALKDATDLKGDLLAVTSAVAVEAPLSYELPKTGGSGSELYYCLGGMLILLVPMGYMLRKKRKKQ